MANNHCCQIFNSIKNAISKICKPKNISNSNKPKNISNSNDKDQYIRYLPKLTGEDLAKVHNEINQNINQRFLVCMGAITLVGTVLGWGTTKINELTKSSLQLSMIFLVGFLSITILIVFYKANRIINNNINMLASYLWMTKSSDWERVHFCIYELKLTKDYFKQTEFIHGIFYYFGLIAFFVPFLVTLFKISNSLRLCMSIDDLLTIFPGFDALTMDALLAIVLHVGGFICYWILLRSASYIDRSKARELWLGLDKKWPDWQSTTKTDSTPPESAPPADRSPPETPPLAPSA